jgi:flagellar assembly protein FliH
MPVIKSTDSPHASLHRAAFNFDDLKGQAEKYLDEVRRQGQQLIEKARQDAAAMRPRFEAEARQAAEQSVQERVEQLANELVSQRLQTLRPALEQAVRAIEKARGDWTAEWEAQAVHLAVAIAGRVIRREIGREPQIQASYVREALELAAGSQQVRVRIHPDDHQALGSLAGQWFEQALARASAELVADPSVSQGGCVVETEHGQIDQQIETQLARIEQELTRS